jgi:ribonuclease HI
MTGRPEYVAVYADESCIGNGREGENPGGAAGVIEWQSPRSRLVRRFDYWISEPATTNNRMALRSVTEAFRGLSAKGRQLNVRFTSDSRYIVDGMTSWVHGWITRGWRRKGGPVENLELWRAAVEAVGAHVVQWEWVRGHAGQPQNEYANHLATRAAAEQTSSGGFRPSGYERWLRERGERAPRLGEAAAPPTADTFKPSRRIWTT